MNRLPALRRFLALFLTLFLAVTPVAITPVEALTPGARAVVLTPHFVPQATALFARMTPPPNFSRKVLINKTISNLLACGVWGSFDALYLTAAASSQAASLNWVQNAYNLSVVNSPTFVADRGFNGDGSTSYLTTGFNPATAPSPHFTQNSGAISVSDRTTRAGNSNAVQFGGSVSTNYNAVILVYTVLSPPFLARINAVGGGVVQAANSGSAGRYIVSRTGSTATTSYKAGASMGVVASAASIAVPNSTMFLDANDNAGTPALFSSDQLSQASIGASMTAGQAACFDSAIAGYLAGVGAQ
jgi:hypothetical protein